MKLLELKDIQKRYSPKTDVLRGVSLTVHHNEIVALQGESGSGKTSLLNIIGTLLQHDEGHYLFDGVSMDRLEAGVMAKFRNEVVGFIFQDHRLFPQFTVAENVTLPCLASNRKVSKAMNERAKMLLTRVGMIEHIDKFPEELSGGECQRVAIARALLMKPKLLLADEPTGSLDAMNSDKVCQLIQNLCKAEQISVLMVTHSDEVASIADRKVHLKNGQIHE